MDSEKLTAALRSARWKFAEADPAAKTELARRIADAGRKLQLITYSDLVRGITFRLPTVNGGVPFQIDVSDWSDLDRAILGDFLGAISTETYLQAGFLATALVVNKQEFMPSDQFFKWMNQLGALPNRKQDTVLAFWADQVNKAHNWYSRRQPAAAG
jgi:hypothetical protein